MLTIFFFDVSYWVRYFYRCWKTRNYKTLSYQDLCVPIEQRIAIMVPCWQEYGVIGAMLNHNVPIIDYANFDVFVGVYPNDLKTVQAVREAEKSFVNVHHATTKAPGPSNKADNLNSIYGFILKHEAKEKIKYEIFLLHDPEDAIHPLSLKLYNYLMPKKEMIQIPVFPLELPYYNWVHWTYADEFAELHTKNLIVREAMGGFVPSAGVGTAFSRTAVDKLMASNQGFPFHTDSVTEDYEAALRLQLLGFKAIFLLQTIVRVVVKKRWYFFGKKRAVKIKERIATRALFPTEYCAAVKQKSRWVFGIALQSWANIGWKGGFMNRYFLFRDRKTAITFLLIGFGYVVFIYWLVVYIWSKFDPSVITLSYYLSRHPLVWALILLCTIIMLERMLQRFIATFKIYGLVAGVLSIPRIVYSNIITFHVFLKAILYFVFNIRSIKNTKWLKTKNHFPSEQQLSKYKLQLGDVLLLKNIVTPDELGSALTEHHNSGERIGSILARKKHLTSTQIMLALAQEYQLNLMDVTEQNILPLGQLKRLASKNYDWLLKHGFLPVALSNNHLTLAILDLGDEKLRRQAQKRATPFMVNYVLAKVVGK